uniref:Putative secreted protein n=1 Tax=Ixodes ricinus TaxID=34613 RepID=A0A6B0UGI1_IXORI
MCTALFGRHFFLFVLLSLDFPWPPVPPRVSTHPACNNVARSHNFSNSELLVQLGSSAPAFVLSQFPMFLRFPPLKGYKEAFLATIQAGS